MRHAAVDSGPLFRLSSTLPHDPEIDLWLAGRPHALGDIARRSFRYMRECGDDVREVMHDGCPVACVGDAPFAYVNVFNAHVNVGFYVGAALDDPAGLLEGNGKRMRHVKIRPGAEPDATALSGLIDAAYAEVRRRVAVESALGVKH